jgi:cyanophycin synthetase
MTAQFARQWARLSRVLDLRSRKMSNDLRLLRVRYYRDYWHRVARLISADIEDLGQEFFRLQRNGKQTFVRGYYVQIDDLVTLNIAGSKSLSQKLLSENGLPVPANRVFDLQSIEIGYEFLAQSRRPLVVKPASGGGGAAVTTGITNRETLKRAATKAASVSTKFIAEEQLEGDNYRLLYIAGELVDVIRRSRPTVIGDGQQTISQLIIEENRQRLTGDSYTSLSILTDDTDVKSYLANEGLSHKFVPEKGKPTVVKGASNQNSARDNHRINDGIHPSFQQLGKRVQRVLNINLLGIDIMTPSLNKSLEEAGGAINEINTTPAFHHHDLVRESDKGYCAGQFAIEYIFGL